MPSALDLSLGAILIGTYLSSVLFGVASVQLYIYLQSGYKDTIWTRASVCGSLAVTTFYPDITHQQVWACWFVSTVSVLVT